MLNQKALSASLPLATILDDHDLVLTPVTGSPLEVLVNATRSDTGFNIATPLDRDTPDGVTINQYVPDIVNIEFIANAKDSVLGICQHDVQMDSIVEGVSQAVKEHLIFAKNVVAPAVEELVVKTTTTLRDINPSTLLGMEVVVWNPPAPLLTSSIEDAVRKFEELPFDSPVMNLRLPDLTASEVIELMMSGTSGLDKSIAEWAAGKGNGFFIKVWENIFQQKQAGLTDTKLVAFRDWIYGNPEKLDMALSIYLLARKLMDSPLPNTEMNLAAFNKTVVEFRNHAAYRLCLALNELDTINKGGILVRSVLDNVTTVNGSVYDSWIAAGGENEILFGNSLNKPVIVSLQDFNTKSGELKALWNRHAVLTATVERNRLFTRTKEVLMKHFNEQIRAVTEGDEATLENRARILDAFENCLHEMREDELSDLWGACLKLLCASRFVTTDARRILMGIERVKKENPKIEIREAAAISAIEYIAHWVSTQLKVTVIKS